MACGFLELSLHWERGLHTHNDTHTHTHTDGIYVEVLEWDIIASGCTNHRMTPNTAKWNLKISHLAYLPNPCRRGECRCLPLFSLSLALHATSSITLLPESSHSVRTLARSLPHLIRSLPSLVSSSLKSSLLPISSSHQAFAQLGIFVQIPDIYCKSLVFWVSHTHTHTELFSFIRCFVVVCLPLFCFAGSHL